MKNLWVMLMLCLLAMGIFNIAVKDIEKPSVDIRNYVGDKSHETKSIFDRFINEAVNQGNMDVIKDLIDENFSLYMYQDKVPFLHGREEFVKILMQIYDSHSHFQLDTNRLEFIAYNNRITVIWNGGDEYENLFQKGLGSMKKENMYGISIYQLVNNKITECRVWMKKKEPYIWFMKEIASP